MQFPSALRPVLLAVGLLVGCPCLAADRPPGVSPQAWRASKEHFKRGAALYKEGRYAEAEEAFAEAHRLSGAPDLLFNLGRAAERQGKRREAAGYLERYLEARPDAPDQESVRAKIEQLRREADEAEKPPEPPPPPVAAPPPPAPLPDRVERPPLGARPEQRPLGPALGVAIGGAALLLGGMGTGVAALLLARDLNAAPDGGRFDRAAYQRGQALEATAIALDVVGAVGLVAGGIWTGVLVHRNRAARKQLSRGPYHLGLLVHGSF